MIDETVSGVIIGGDYIVYGLYYEGRKQGPTIYSDSLDNATIAAREYKERLSDSFGEAFRQIYPHDLWELRTFLE